MLMLCIALESFFFFLIAHISTVHREANCCSVRSNPLLFLNFLLQFKSICYHPWQPQLKWDISFQNTFGAGLECVLNSEHMRYRYYNDILVILTSVYSMLVSHSLLHPILPAAYHSYHTAIMPHWRSNYTYFLASWCWLFCLTHSAHRQRCNHLSVYKWWSGEKGMILDRKSVV